MNKQLFFFTLLLIGGLPLFSQAWVDTLYGYQKFTDISYGTATDFAGNDRDLMMDIGVPVGDTPPASGRPLMLFIHGGAFMIGHKADGWMPRLMEEFSKRGYVTVSINYRLGLFQNQTDHNCNISYIPVPWNCLQQQDTSEWIRAAYRGTQDAHGALRYLSQNAATYNIDPGNTFVVGESAGAFIAMQVGYMDDPDEIPAGVGALPDAARPNNRYETMCVVNYGWDVAIDSMDLTRPDLGSPEGDLNPGPRDYCIKGVGSFYGGMFDTLFVKKSQPDDPALYLFHQPKDMLVPFNYGRIFDGYSACAWGVCGQGIYYRPHMRGGKSIQALLDSLDVNGVPVPDYQTDFTSNTLDCGTQILTGTYAHAIDNFSLRTGNMAAFFANYVTPGTNCGTTSARDEGAQPFLQIYPNPAHDQLELRSDPAHPMLSVQLFDLQGRQVGLWETQQPTHSHSLEVPKALSGGIYFLSVDIKGGGQVRQRMMIMK